MRNAQTDAATDSDPDALPVDRLPIMIAVKVGDQFRPVEIDSIDWIAAEGNYLRIHIGSGSLVVRRTMKEFIRILDPHRFLRIHRSTVINLGRVTAFEPLRYGEMEVLMRDGMTLTCSRRYRRAIEGKVAFLA